MSCNIVWAQTNPIVGAVKANTNELSNYIEQALLTYKADIIIFPELALTGYPLEDLLFRPNLYQQIEEALNTLLPYSKNCTIIIGHPSKITDVSEPSYVTNQFVYNSASVLQNCKIIATYHKRCLPNYHVFDECRYFLPGKDSCIFTVNDIRFGLTICEDLWHNGPAEETASQGIDCLINLNASPFHRNKQQERIDLIKQKTEKLNCAILYVNLVGGQDELIFDGHSLFSHPNMEQLLEDRAFDLSLSGITFSKQTCTPVSQHLTEPKQLATEQTIHRALVLGVRDYVQKNHFNKVVIGLSGGIDSALTLAIAVAALGAQNVEAFMLQSRHTSELSLLAAKELAENFDVTYQCISIESAFSAFLNTLKGRFKDLPIDLTEQNIQARCRAMLLMAIANKEGKLVLSTGNKSELAVGYATLYGDMAGAYGVLKDVSKHWVYILSRYVNEQAGAPIIPQTILERPPSAELAPEQRDDDTLPPYDCLDQILELYVEQNLPKQSIVDKGFDVATVDKVIRMIKLNEYKRFQAAPGPRVTQQGFGKDWRYPMTAQFEE